MYVISVDKGSAREARSPGGTLPEISFGRLIIVTLYKGLGNVPYKVKEAYVEKKSYIPIVTAFLLTAGLAFGQVNVPVTNPSFEDPALDSGAFTQYSVDGAATSPGWTPNEANLYGIADLTGDADVPPGAADGDNALWFNGSDGGSDTLGFVTQDITEPIVGGETYTLTVAINQRQEFAVVPYLVQLLEDSVMVAEDDNSVDVTPADLWDSTIVEWTAPQDSDGNLLTILLGESVNTGIQINFDDVVLTRTPEPGSLMLLAFGGLAFLRRRRMS
jgi:hypothetical protein